MKILVVGPGAIGRLVAIHLRRGSAPDTALLDRDLARARRLRARGLFWSREDGSNEVVPIDVLGGGEREVPHSRSRGESWDLLVVCVKSYDVEEAVVSGTRFLGENAGVLVLSNGLDLIQRVEDAGSTGVGLPRDRIMAGTITYGATCSGENGVRMTGRGRIRIGSPARGASTRARVEEITLALAPREK